MDQLVLLVLIAAISLINWLLQKSAEHREKKKAEALRRDGPEPEPDEPFHAPETTGPNEQTRKFLEALGLPEDALPPRPVPAPLAPPQLPSSVPTPVEQPRNFLHKVRPDLEQRLFPVVHEEVAPVAAPRPRRQPSLAATATAAEPAAMARISDLLSGPDALRRAMMVREVLGPPRALADL